MNDKKRIQLMHLCSNVFPTGIFSHSFGYEMMLEQGIADDLQGYREYLFGMLRMGVGRTDTAVLRMAYEEPKKSLHWDELCSALKPTVELRKASSKTGNAFFKTFQKMYPENDLTETELCDMNYAVVFGLACRSLEIPLRDVLEGYLTSTVLSYIQVGIKLIPLSQVDGQILMKECYEEIEQCVEEVMEMKEEDIFSFTPMLDIASMRHETQFSRMYMS